MRKIILGKTGMEISELGFGGIPISALDRETAVAVVKECYASGITFYDTANMYGDSEDKIGEALKEVRSSVVIATKSTDRTKKGAAGHIQTSLKRLQTDYIDLFQFHNVSRPEEKEEIFGPGGAMEAVEEYVEKGAIRHVGFSSHHPDVAAELCATGRFATVQFPFNFVELQATERLFPEAEKQGMGIIAMKPFGGGLLERADLCFGFLRQHPKVLPIPGMGSVDEVKEIVALYSRPAAPLTGEQKAAMEEIAQRLGDRFCHRCGYCLPCPQEVAIPFVLMYPSFLPRMSPARVKDLAQKPMESAENCIECGECVEKCPYNLPIYELMAEYKAQYEAFIRQHNL